MTSATLRDCPVCVSAGARTVLHRQRFEAGLLGDGYAVAVCAACGAGFADGIPDQPTLDRYYAERSKYAVTGAESPFDIGRFEVMARQLAAKVPLAASVLDVGCATGGFLATLKKIGFENVLGADPSPACAEAARKMHGIEVVTTGIVGLVSCTSHRLRLVQDTNPTGGGNDGLFDLITLLGVLEHIRDVRAAVAELSKLLAPGGRIFVAVPDVQGLATSRNAPFQQFSMEHVNFFSRQSLARLMGECGFVAEARWQERVQWRAGVVEPIVSGLFGRSPVSGKWQAASVGAVKDGVTEKALREYLEVSVEVDVRIASKIDRLVADRTPLLVWGAGALTRRLLAGTNLAKANIQAFVDSSSHAQAAPLAGRPVLAPQAITGRTEAIVVASTAFEQEIIGVIRGDLRMSNELITFPAIGD